MCLCHKNHLHYLKIPSQRELDGAGNNTLILRYLINTQMLFLVFQGYHFCGGGTDKRRKAKQNRLQIV